MSEIIIKVDDIIWRKDLYPRFEPDPATIQQYTESIDLLPPVEVNQHNELIDGYHRWTAHKKVGLLEIPAFVTPTESDNHFLKLAISRNAAHGLQLSNAEKKSFVLRIYSGYGNSEKAELAELFKVSERTINNWTSRRDKDLKAERNKRIFDLWLQCWTLEEIADETGVTIKTVDNTVKEFVISENFQKLQILANYQDEGWTPPLYNIWKQQIKSNSVSHFGNSEASIVDNLLYMLTDPFDIVVDPFAGGGSTADICKRRLRRYWVSDRLPIVERLDIRKADIATGPPPLHKRWGDVSLLYLDPPYWKQAQNQYSQDEDDLANMTIDKFYDALCGFTLSCAEKMKAGSHIAILIQPTQWKNEGKVITDHIFDLLVRLTGNKLKLKMRIICPYESQQCTAQQVEWAKANRQVLVLSRELIIWEVL